MARRDSRGSETDERSPEESQPGTRRSSRPDVDQRLDDLAQAVASFAHLVERVRVRRPADGGWGEHEVLAHLVFWHEHYVRLARAQLAGTNAPLPTATLKSLNAAAVRLLADEPLRVLTRRLRVAQAKLEIMSRLFDMSRVRVQLRAGSKAWTWPEFLRRVTGHIRSHESQLRRARRT